MEPHCIGYITGHEKEGYLERILYTDSTLSKNGWNANTTITKAIIEEKIYPTSCARFFNSCSNLTTIENFENIIITKYCTTLFCMFQLCSKLLNIDCTNRDVSNVTDMHFMFFFCYALTNVGNLSNWNTSKVTDMYCMFAQCYSLTNIDDLSMWNLRNVITTKQMFANCASLTNIGDLSNWNAPKCTTAKFMFAGNNNVDKMCFTELKIDNLFKNSIVTDLYCMFQKCYMLTTVGNLSNLNTSKVTSMYGMFYECKNINSLGVLSIPKGCDTTYVLNELYYLTTITKSGTISQSVSFAWSPLTHDSALVLINALDENNHGTLTLSSSTYATLTDEDKAIATNKCWTIAA